MKLHSIKWLVMWYMHRPFRIKEYIKRNSLNEARIRKKEAITVVFFASNVSMWHYQGLYEEMLKYPRFKPYIVLSPLNAYDPEQKKQCVLDLREYFNRKGIDYIDYDTENMKGADVKALQPDLLFYPQPFYTVMCKEHSYYRFKDSLLGYYPYFFHRGTQLSFEYNEDFHNRAWRLYYESIYQKQEAHDLASVGDYNVRVVGYPKADIYQNQNVVDVWKDQPIKKKRIIWAPHFTVNGDGWASSSNFLWMADFMLELAYKYADRIQLAFKPHPRLLSELYQHKDWGKEKADAYYERWQLLGNGQLETGDYTDLFMTSDAMIHDCGSFSVEYQYTQKPVMYVSQYMDKFIKTLSEFGKKIYELHYIGKTKEDIVNFIEDVVLAGNDVMMDKKKDFVKTYLLPPNGKTVAENTMDDIIKSLS